MACKQIYERAEKRKEKENEEKICIHKPNEKFQIKNKVIKTYAHAV